MSKQKKNIEKWREKRNYRNAVDVIHLLHIFKQMPQEQQEKVIKGFEEQLEKPCPICKRIYVPTYKQFDNAQLKSESGNKQKNAR